VTEQGSSNTVDACAEIESGSWMDPALGGPATGLDSLGTIVDPLRVVEDWGIGWLSEQIRPLREALGLLAGDPSQIEEHARTWTNVADEVRNATQTVRQQADTDLASWTGNAAEAYRTHLAAQLQAAEVAVRAAEGLSAAVTGAGLAVAATRERVREAIAEFVSVLAARLTEWLAEEACTAGSATPWVVSRVAALVGRRVDTVMELIRALLTSLKQLASLMGRLTDTLDELAELLPRLHRR
jgi:uncharacterized protein YukE